MKTKVLRNRIVHGYGSVNKDLLWDISHNSKNYLGMYLSKSSFYSIKIAFAKEHSIDFVAVYGSFPNDNSKAPNDIDLIIDTQHDIYPNTLEEFEERLRNLIDVKMDLITSKLMISSLLFRYIWRLKQYQTPLGHLV